MMSGRENVVRVSEEGEATRRQQQLYYAATPPSSHSSTCKGCCCCLFLLFSFLGLLVLAALLLIVLVVKPRNPHLDLSQVGFQYMAIRPNPNDPATASLYLIIRLVLSVVNPNRVRIRYGESRLSLVFRGVTLGRASVPAFFQRAHSVTEVVATVAVDGVNLSEADAADFTRDALLNDRVELRVLGHVAAKIRLFNLDSPPLQVSVNCVIVISPRKQSLTYKQCGLEGLNLSKIKKLTTMDRCMRRRQCNV
ncbi:hypothetical protein VNO77_05355 [Canavalia gladiata]|uniref:Late embryogenesis abundant protein LEA-2 subgroup domain-containing protein n=1 Tax=Canavalia gladiata TaxID=3824 RepID=A0AAN9MYV0_CANGL